MKLQLPPNTPGKNIPLQPDRNPDPTKQRPGGNEPGKVDPTRIEQPEKSDPTRIDNPPPMQPEQAPQELFY